MTGKSQSSSKDQLGADVAVLKSQMTDVKQTVGRIETKLDNSAYATRGDIADLDIKIEKQESRTANYPLVEKIVFGLVTLILIAVASAIIYLVVNKGGA